MQITVLGSGDALHGAGRGHAALLVEDALGRLLVDCGASTPQALARLGVPLASIDAVAITHLHGDHFAGVPFLFLDALVGAGRSRPLVVAGPVRSSSRVEALFRVLYAHTAERVRPFFLDYREIEAGEAIDLAGRRLLAYAAPHMAGDDRALSYRLETEGKVVAVSGDSAPGAGLAEVAQGADLFVCECTDAHERPDSKHLSVDDVARLRPGWTARRVLLTHLSAAARTRAASLSGVELADDGLVVTL